MEEGVQESHGRGGKISTTWTPGYGRPWGGQLWKRFCRLYDLASQGMATPGEEICGREVCSYLTRIPRHSLAMCWPTVEGGSHIYLPQPGSAGLVLPLGVKPQKSL